MISGPEQEIASDNTIQQVRSEVLDSTLLVFSFISIPALLASLARAPHMGWQPVMTLEVIMVAMLWGVTLGRHAISYQVRAILLLGCLFTLGVFGFWTVGLAGGGLWLFFMATVMATMLFGARWGWILLAAIMVAMLVTVQAIQHGLIVYPFDVAAYVLNSRVLYFALIAIFLLLAMLTASLGTFHSSLLDSIAQSKRRASLLAEEINDRHRAEAALQKSEEKFRRIVDNIQDVYFETGLDGTIHYCSPSCAETSGYRQDELIGQSATMLYHNPADRQLLLAALKKEGRVRGLEILFAKKDGTLYDAEFNADIVVDEEGQASGMHGTIRDVTIAKKVKEQIERAQKMEAIGLMAGGVAHDLNNIIAAIVGYPDLMLGSLPQESELRPPLEAIRDSGHRAAGVIADLLTVSKEAAASQEPHDLHELIAYYLDSPEYGKIAQSFPQLRCQVSHGVPEAVISCSAVHINKCLMNLVNNAAEAMVGPGEITLATGEQKVDEIFGKTHDIKPGEYLILRVEDNGPGIKAEDLEHIFEPFYSKKHLGRSGTGLGLTIVWNTVRNHGGTVTVTSGRQGTSFQLYFPRHSGVAVSKNRPAELPQEAVGRGERVLIVDDEPAVLDVASQILSKHGYEVAGVKSGEEALSFLAENSADILLLDMVMEPGISGRQTYEKALQLAPDQKALISSGFSENGDVQASLQMGAGGFIRKPYTKEQLCLAVRQVLDG
ncbi:MAG: ATP-binding protein [Thermodesulfobacteriota bacterium]